MPVSPRTLKLPRTSCTASALLSSPCFGTVSVLMDRLAVRTVAHARTTRREHLATKLFQGLYVGHRHSYHLREFYHCFDVSSGFASMKKDVASVVPFVETQRTQLDSNDPSYQATNLDERDKTARCCLDYAILGQLKSSITGDHPSTSCVANLFLYHQQLGPHR